jgi:hypothetical protein
VGWK